MEDCSTDEQTQQETLCRRRYRQPRALDEAERNRCLAYSTVSMAIVTYCVSLFAVVYRINFFRSPVNIIDLLATATFYVDLILSLLEKENDLSEMINLIQVARLFRLTRHSPGLKVSILHLVSHV